MHVLLLVTGPLGILVLLMMGSFDRTIDAMTELVSMPAKLVKAGVETVTQPFKQWRINAALPEHIMQLIRAHGGNYLADRF